MLEAQPGSPAQEMGGRVRRASCPPSSQPNTCLQGFFYVHTQGSCRRLMVREEKLWERAHPRCSQLTVTLSHCSQTATSSRPDLSNTRSKHASWNFQHVSHEETLRRNRNVNHWFALVEYQGDLLFLGKYRISFIDRAASTGQSRSFIAFISFIFIL